MNFFYNEFSIAYPNVVKLRGDDRVLLKTIGGNWFLVKRAGERSWEANCVADAHEADYTNISVHTLTGNSKTIMPNIHEYYKIEKAYFITNKKQYRTAMISILATGEIDARIEVNIRQLNDDKN